MPVQVELFLPVMIIIGCVDKTAEQPDPIVNDTGYSADTADTSEDTDTADTTEGTEDTDTSEPGGGGGDAPGDVVDFSGTFDGQPFSERCDATTGSFFNMEWVSSGRQYLFIQCRDIDHWINVTLSFDEGSDNIVEGSTAVHADKILYADVNIYDNGEAFCNIGGIYNASITTTTWNPGTGQWAGSFDGRCDDGSRSHDVTGTFDVTL